MPVARFKVLLVRLNIRRMIWILDVLEWKTEPPIYFFCYWRYGHKRATAYAGFLIRIQFCCINVNIALYMSSIYWDIYHFPKTQRACKIRIYEALLKNYFYQTNDRVRGRLSCSVDIIFCAVNVICLYIYKYSFSECLYWFRLEGVQI